jgi:replication-associated recombination protein RarA
MKGLRVFGSTNNPTKLSKPLKSRFQMYLVPSYDNDQFVRVMEFCLLKQNIVKSPEMAKELAFAMLRYKVTNVRTAISICSLINERDSHQDIKRVIENYLINDASRININFNEQEG